MNALSRNGFVTSLMLAVAGVGQSSPAGRESPVVGTSLRYCNPLAIETSSQNGSPQGVSLGDVTVVREKDRYYMFCTGGGAWVSSDLVHWKYSPVQGRVPVAPGVVKYNGYFYMSGNNSPVYRASDILGPYESLGPWKDEKGQPWTGTAPNPSPYSILGPDKRCLLPRR